MKIATVFLENLWSGVRIKVQGTGFRVQGSGFGFKNPYLISHPRIKGKDTRKEDRGNRSEIGNQRSEDQKVRR